MTSASRQNIVPLDLRSANFKDAPERLWQRLHQGGPIITTRQPLLGRLVFATSHEASLEMLRDQSRFTVDARRAGQARSSGVRWWVPSVFRVLADNMLTREGNDHRRLRQLVEKGFRNASLVILQPRIEALSDAAMDRLARARSPDIVRDVAKPLPLQVISELLGLTPESMPELDHLDDALQRLSGVSTGLDLFRVIPAILQIRKGLSLAIQRRRAEPQDDLLSALVSVRIGADRLSDDELLSMIFLLYVAGHETTTHLISVGVLTLLREPASREQLSPCVTTQQTTELLRYLSPVQFSKPRFVVADTLFHGAELRRGDTISALLACANHDPAWVSDPGRLDFSRPAGRQLGFGAGSHVCLGLQLALRETATVLTQLFQRYPAMQLMNEAAVPDWTTRLGLRGLSALPVRLK